MIRVLINYATPSYRHGRLKECAHPLVRLYFLRPFPEGFLPSDFSLSDNISSSVRMYLFIAPFSTLFLFISQHYSVAAVPDRRIEERQDQDLSFCFGDNSICTFSNSLYSQCQNYFSDTTEWYNCICGNGYVSVDEAWVLQNSS